MEKKENREGKNHSKRTHTDSLKIPKDYISLWIIILKPIQENKDKPNKNQKKKKN